MKAHYQNSLRYEGKGYRGFGETMVMTADRPVQLLIINQHIFFSFEAKTAI